MRIRLQRPGSEWSEFRRGSRTTVLKTREWIFLYLPPLFLKLVFGGLFCEIPLLLLALALATHLHIYRLGRKHLELRRDFHRGTLASPIAGK